MQTYEALRAEVLRGQSPAEGWGALIYHGMWRGLLVMLSTVRAPTSAPEPREPPGRPLTGDPELVRVLANMLLRAQSEVRHVY